MSRHVADKPRTKDSERLKRYTDIEREKGGAHEQTLELQRRAKAGTEESRRAKEYLRIDRGVDT